jgi:hypothetical protein
MRRKEYKKHYVLPVAAQVANTERFPFSAVGELTGQLGATATTGLECTGTLIGTPAQATFSLLFCRQCSQYAPQGEASFA